MKENITFNRLFLRELIRAGTTNAFSLLLDDYFPQGSNDTTRIRLLNLLDNSEFDKFGKDDAFLELFSLEPFFCEPDAEDFIDELLNPFDTAGILYLRRIFC